MFAQAITIANDIRNQYELYALYGKDIRLTEDKVIEEILIK